ncbi:MAG TPA: biotin carboxylase N-terminal domain-containing protein [Myxococcaceae bacterium]|nr:biotin carboxylase N-terminal domain-containing protein [Myxococcaceae bacterium]
MFKKLLIANRGEIARRINVVARRMGLQTVAVYSDADRELPFVREADEAIRLGPAPPKESYLNIPVLIDAARAVGADAVHPGYGFVSESAEFAQACQSAGIAFVGPSADVMAAMKDKSQARRIVQAAGVPVVPGSQGLVPDAPAALAEAQRIGYPVLCKAAGGGGGIGMAVAENAAALEKAFRQSSDRARSAFGREGVYLERYFSAPRHIEVQVLADGREGLIHAYERECSIQRRHQKVIEEAPSPLFAGGAESELAERMRTAALNAARAFHYVNAGTVEFLVQDGEFYFIEMNARLQVEHPVTELTTGLDLIGWQLRIAAGEPLTVGQQDVRRQGAALEFRIYAEDPVKFLPSPGQIRRFVAPVGEGVRLDSGYEEGSTVTPYYDPMIAKLIVSAATRDQAIARAEAALQAFVIEGLKTNIPLHLRVLRDPAFVAGTLSTRFLEQHARAVA